MTLVLVQLEHSHPIAVSPALVGFPVQTQLPQSRSYIIVVVLLEVLELVDLLVLEVDVLLDVELVEVLLDVDDVLLEDEVVDLDELVVLLEVELVEVVVAIAQIWQLGVNQGIVTGTKPRDQAVILLALTTLESGAKLTPPVALPWQILLDTILLSTVPLEVAEKATP